MQQLSKHRVSEHRARPRIAKILGRVAGALLFTTALCQSDLAHAAGHGGGGGFHGGAGFHGGGFHAGAFHGGFGGFHGRFAGMHNGFGERHEGFRGGLGFGYYGYPYGSNYYPDYGYYGSGQPSASQNWYYCSDPEGYYPYVAQCNTGWQTVPAS